MAGREGGGAVYQDEVSVLRAAVLIGQFEDVALLDELVGGAHDVFLAAQELVHLQQLPHSLLQDNNRQRQRFARAKPNLFHKNKNSSSLSNRV